MDFLIVSLPQNRMVSFSMTKAQADDYLPRLERKVANFKGEIIVVARKYGNDEMATNEADLVNSKVIRDATWGACGLVNVPHWHDLNPILRKIINRYSDGKNNNVTVVGMSREIWIASIVKCCKSIENCNVQVDESLSWGSFTSSRSRDLPLFNCNYLI